jgi:hypothetical protein
LEFVDGMSLYRAYFSPGAIDPYGQAESAVAGVELVFGATAYDGFGGGGNVTLSRGNEACLCGNTPSHREVYNVRVHGEVGLGIGGSLDLGFKIIEAEYKLATVNVDYGGQCVTPCGGPYGLSGVGCCKVCGEIYINLPFVIPAESFSAGLASFSASISLYVKGSFRGCWNSPGCPTPGIGLGFVGGVYGSVKAKWGWAFGEATISEESKAMIVGKPSMIDW